MRKLQNLGKALMNPVAVLPLAALMLGFGYFLDPTYGSENAIAAFLIKAGGAVVDNLPLLFAVGVAYGLSKDHNGAAALSGLVAMLVLTTLLSEGSVGLIRSGGEVLPTEGFGKINNAFTGIISGIVASIVYNKFHDKKLPDALAFFSGRRMVPIITSFAMILISVILYFAWPLIYGGLVVFGESIQKLGAWGAGIFGFFNRLLIPTGLHHALNAVFWFDIAGIDDLNNFIQSAARLQQPDLYPNVVKGVTGIYQAGYFPIMMGGLLGAALAMYHTAKPEKKKIAGSLLLSAALASFFSGVTEVIEFSFVFLAPGLYLIHALLTASSMIVAALLKATAGFGFSAGFFDFLLSINNPIANNIWYLPVMMVAYFVIYYALFRFFIVKFNLKTPGREDDASEDEGIELSKDTNYTEMAKTILAGLGGKENIDTLDYCITRLRINVKDNTLVNEKQIKSAGVSGLIRPSQKGVHIIIGQQVQFVFDELKKLI